MEEGTPFARWYEQGRLSFPRDDDAADMYGKAVQVLTSAGYEHYEVSVLVVVLALSRLGGSVVKRCSLQGWCNAIG